MTRDDGREFTVAGKRYVWIVDQETEQLSAIPYEDSPNQIIDWAMGK